MKLVGIVFAFVVGAYFVVRAIVEVVTLDYGDAASYETGLGRTVVARRARRALPAWRHLPRTHDLGRTTSPPAHQPLTTPTTGWSTHPERGQTRTADHSETPGSRASVPPALRSVQGLGGRRLRRRPCGSRFHHVGPDHGPNDGRPVTLGFQIGTTDSGYPVIHNPPSTRLHRRPGGS